MLVYDFDIQKVDGDSLKLEVFKGKVLLIVNTASKCAFTPQYKELQSLYEKYHERGFEILAFPCNQFGNQEPDPIEKIQSFCQKNYGVSFPIFAKVDVNGRHTHPLFRYLKKNALGFLGTQRIKWNFTKFLVDQKGRVIGRFAPMVSPSKLDNKIGELLKP